MNDRLVRRISVELSAGRPLRVGFIVNDRSKWNADSLLDEVRDAGWSPELYLCLSDARYADRDDRSAAYCLEREFFSRLESNLVDLYDPAGDREVPVEDAVDADVVFLQQPWGMKEFPRRLAGRSLSAYMHYGFMLMANDGMHYHIGSFHSYLWRYFAQTEEHRLMHLRHDPAAYDKVVVTGYPKLDTYLAEGTEAPGVWPAPGSGRRRIIYAPHHSLGKDNLGMSTFAWNHDFILNLARAIPDTQWAYKPHPNLRYSVVRNKIMTREEYVRYEEAWKEMPNAIVYDDGHYFDIFKSSDAIITDCGSFLAEYLPTGKPIIWLSSPTSVGFNPVGASIAAAFYKVTSKAGIEQVLRQVVLDQHDPLKSERSEAVRRLFPGTGKAATAIVEHLRSEFAYPTLGGDF